MFRRSQNPRRYVTIVIGTVLALVLPILGGCGGGNLCCPPTQQGNTQVIIQSEEPTAQTAIPEDRAGGTR